LGGLIDPPPADPPLVDSSPCGHVVEIAKSAGINRTDFLLALARMGRDSFTVDFEDLDRELSRG
jgi:hypothetical protein